jgi:hypothetical protein
VVKLLNDQIHGFEHFDKVEAILVKFTDENMCLQVFKNDFNTISLPAGFISPYVLDKCPTNWHE